MDSLKPMAELISNLKVIGLAVLVVLAAWIGLAYRFTIYRRKAGRGFVLLAVAGGLTILLLFGLALAWQHGGSRNGPGPQSSTPSLPDGRTAQNAADVLERILGDLRSCPPADHSQRRYLTLTHRHNDPDVTEQQLQADRDLLPRLARCLGPPGTTFPAVDREQTVFAIDFKVLRRDAEETWDLILRSYPYGLSYENAADNRLVELARQVRELTGCPLPYLRADWLAQAVLHPPLGGADGELTGLEHNAVAALRPAAEEYARQSLGLAGAARELQLDDPAQLTHLLRTQPRFRQKLGLGPLLTNQAISRSVWESLQFTTSPFQELSRELHQGTPVQVR